MNDQENKSENSLEILLKKHGDILEEEVDKCTKCKGKGEKQIFKDRDFMGSVTCEYCNHGKINLHKIYREETIDEIKQRLMINFLKPINDGSIKKDFIYCIDEFLKGTQIVPTKLKEKFSYRYSINKFIESKWENSKSKNPRSLLHIYIQYFLRTPTSPQLRRIKNVTGIGKNWYRLTMDYYQCSRKITAADEKFEENKQQLENYSKLDDSKKSELLKESRQAYSTMSSEDILRVSFIEQLFWCIENNPQIYKFNEQEVSFLNIESQKILMSKLNTSQSTHAKEFLNGWKNTIESHINSLYAIDNKVFEVIFTKIRNDRNPYSIIEEILIDDGTKFKHLEDDDGLFYDYKASTFATQEGIDRKISFLTKKRVNTANLKNEAIKLADIDVMNGILKTIVAFLNNDRDHGIILIGVGDDGNIRGIEKYLSTYNERKNKKLSMDEFLDSYRRHIQEEIADARQPYLDTNFKNGNIIVRIVTIPKTKQKIVVIKVKPNAKEACYFKKFDERYPKIATHVAYVRKNGTNSILDGKPLEEFAKKFVNN